MCVAVVACLFSTYLLLSFFKKDYSTNGLFSLRRITPLLMAVAKSGIEPFLYTDFTDRTDIFIKMRKNPCCPYDPCTKG